MIYISHRGNFNGKVLTNENNPKWLDYLLHYYKELHIEIDLRYENNKLYLGHDNAEYEITLKWLVQHKDRLWIHCKDVSSIIFLKEINFGLHYFWHENDTLTITSNGYLWVFPGKQPIKNSIVVMPELNNDDVSECIGICSDYIIDYL